MYHREDIAKYLEKGRMDPSFKKEDPLEKTNYRPITVLTVVDKIFEQLQSKQMPKNLETIFDLFMSAYRKMYSCQTTFDTMHLTLLLVKLKPDGSSEGALSLMHSFFEELKGRTKLGTAVSEWKEIKMGCPQESNLGPLLWNICQNDLFYLSRASILSM